MVNKKQLNDEELDKVSAGDNGNTRLEWADEESGVYPLYNVGDYVEVYNSVMHVRTKRSRIDAIYINRFSDCRLHRNQGSANKYYPVYHCFIIEDNEYRDVTSNDIERSL